MERRVTRRGVFLCPQCDKWWVQVYRKTRSDGKPTSWRGHCYHCGAEYPTVMERKIGETAGTELWATDHDWLDLTVTSRVFYLGFARTLPDNTKHIHLMVERGEDRLTNRLRSPLAEEVENASV